MIGRTGFLVFDIPDDLARSSLDPLHLRSALPRRRRPSVALAQGDALRARLPAAVTVKQAC